VNVRPSFAGLVACLAALSCGAPERRPPSDGPDVVRHRPPADAPGTADHGAPHDPFDGTAASHVPFDGTAASHVPFDGTAASSVPAGAECAADSDCTTQTYPDPAKDGCCPHWCGHPVTSVARAKELEKLYPSACRVDCPPYDCAAFREPTPRCDAGRCVAAATPRPHDR